MINDKKIISFSLLLIAFSILYYFVYFIPSRDKRDFLVSREKECLRLHKEYLEDSDKSKTDGYIGGRVKYIPENDKCYGDYSFVWDSGFSGYIIEHFSDTNIENYSELYKNQVKTGDVDRYKIRIKEIFGK